SFAGGTPSHDPPRRAVAPEVERRCDVPNHPGCTRGSDWPYSRAHASRSRTQLRSWAASRRLRAYLRLRIPGGARRLPPAPGARGDTSDRRPFGRRPLDRGLRAVSAVPRFTRGSPACERRPRREAARTQGGVASLASDARVALPREPPACWLSTRARAPEGTRSPGLPEAIPRRAARATCNRPCRQ